MASPAASVHSHATITASTAGVAESPRSPEAGPSGLSGLSGSSGPGPSLPSGLPGLPGSAVPSSTASSLRHPPSSRPFDEVSIQYSSFPSAQTPPPPTPTRPFPFSHDDTERSRHAYDTLAASAKAYRVTLGQLSAAASNFGAALEACARLKEARAQPYPPGPYSTAGSTNLAESSILNGGSASGMSNSSNANTEVSCTADVLLATSGLYYLMANQQGILAETVYRSFELPIVHEMDRYSGEVEAEQESYAAAMREASRDIRRLEKEGVKLRKPRQRDVGRMRSHLAAMTAALDALTAQQATHAVALLDQSRGMSGIVSQASRNLVRAEMDILDGLARKGWPGGGLDGVLEGAVDLFSTNSDDLDEAGLASSTILAGAPSLMLLGGGPVSTGLSRGADHANSQSHSRIRRDDGEGGGGGDASDAPTVGGSVAGSGGKLFSILPGGSILNENNGGDSLTDASSEKRGRSHRKKKRSKLHRHHHHNEEEGETDPDQGQQQQQQQQQNASNGETTAEDDETEAAETASSIGGPPETEEDLDDTASSAAMGHGHRHRRSDSLTVDIGGPYSYYQSLDGVAKGDESLAEHDERATSRVGGRSRGRARPFSPRREPVDPQEDVFTAVPKEEPKDGGEAETKEEVEVGTEPQTEAETTGEEKGKAIDQAPQETDEGVNAWR